MKKRYWLIAKTGLTVSIFRSSESLYMYETVDEVYDDNKYIEKIGMIAGDSLEIDWLEHEFTHEGKQLFKRSTHVVIAHMDDKNVVLKTYAGWISDSQFKLCDYETELYSMKTVEESNWRVSFV